MAYKTSTSLTATEKASRSTQVCRCWWRDAGEASSFETLVDVSLSYLCSHFKVKVGSSRDNDFNEQIATHAR